MGAYSPLHFWLPTIEDIFIILFLKRMKNYHAIIMDLRIKGFLNMIYRVWDYSNSRIGSESNVLEMPNLEQLIVVLVDKLIF